MADDKTTRGPELDDAILDRPLAVGRDIDERSHSGWAPQRVPATLRQIMDNSHRGGYQSFEQLQAVLEGNGEEPLVRNDNGDWVRRVSVHTGETVDQNGQPHAVAAWQERNVSLTMEGARAATADGIETDVYGPIGWVRRGVKPERDHATAAAASRHEGREEWLEPTSSTRASRLTVREPAARRGRATTPPERSAVGKEK